MAHFRGTIQGSRGEASRLGHKSSGLTVEAQSWQGKVTVSLHTSNASDTDIAEVWLEPHYGAGTRALLYRGPVGHFAPSPLSGKGTWPPESGVSNV